MALFTKGDDEISEQTVSFGLWAARNEQKLKRAGLISFIAVDAVIVVGVLFLLWSWVSHMGQTKEIWEGMALSPLSTVNRVVPTAVVITRSTVVRRDDASVDAVVVIQNQNDTWAAAELTYEFVISGQSVGQRTVGLAPQQEHFATAVRVPWTGENTPQAEVRIVDVKWRRLVSTEILPSVDWQVANPSFDVVRLVQNQQEEVSQFGMTLINGSAYGFVQPEVVVILRDSSGEAVAIGSISLNSAEAFSEQELSFQWPGRLPDSLTADVTVNTNRIDPEKIIIGSEVEEPIAVETDEE